MPEDKFTESIYQYSVDTGKSPTKMYLGESEWEELKIMVRALTGFVYNQDQYSNPEFKGLKIFLVKAPQHLTVA